MTTPFTAPFEASLKANPQGGVLRVEGMHVVYPNYSCCISGTSVELEKDPTPIIRAGIQEVCANAPYCIDILGSYSATGTIVSYSVDWGDGNVTNGAWPPGGDICHPLGGWILDWIYEVTLTVTDLLGASASTAIEVTVLDCVDPTPPIILGTDNGPWFMADVAIATVVPIDHASLTVVGSLDQTSIRVYDYPDGRQSLWMSALCGIYEYRYMPVGFGKWEYLVTQADVFNKLGIGGTLDFYQIDMDPVSPGRGWFSAGMISGVAPFFTHWALFGVTTDYWDTFDLYTVQNGNGSYLQPKFAVAPNSDGQVIYYRANRWGVNPNSNIHKSVNGGAAWAIVDPNNVGDNEGALDVPFFAPGLPDSVIYVGANAFSRYSTDSGATWGAAAALGRVTDMHNPWQRWDIVDVCNYDNLKEWEVGVALNTLFTWPVADTAFGLVVLARDPTDWKMVDVIVGGHSGLTNTMLWRWQSGIGSTGIWHDLENQSGGATVTCLAHVLVPGPEWP